ncbi:MULTISPECIES: glycosyltransferase family 4 protein [unclassified Rhodococcus (in: high G+C Gram-positive bacteria)]|uniref:glycosyltransferase family 4 protein n=1 Tax=unclassified Rhodococcus (in: high G+C Gram-positive bacteria) TaxID=192944 RepID=UPI0009EF5629|nr:MULTISPECIES: glycosyltransferase family 4 protein [unclassified Rhodococcus (in: high G+C Gram-positive bacteria)]
MNPKSITIIGINYSPEKTGIAPYTSGLAENLAAAGYEVCVITAYPHYPEWRIAEGYNGLSRTEFIRGVAVHRKRSYVPSNPSPFTRLMLEATFAIRAIFSNWKDPDVIISVTPSLISTLAVQLRLKLIHKSRRAALGIWVQDLYGLGVAETGTLSGRSAKLMSKVESYSLRNASRVAVIHDRFKDVLTNTMGIDRGRVDVVRNWNHSKLEKLDDRDNERHRLTWADDEFVVLHAGNMGVKQGLHSVIEAAKLAQSRCLKIKFILLGDGNQRKSLQSLAGSCTHVRFLDPLPDDQFSRAIQAADALLVNELESLSSMAVPSKLTTYFASGVPIIAATDSKSVTAGEISASGAGITVTPNDPEALLRSVEILRSDPKYARAIGLNGPIFRDRNLSENAAMSSMQDWIAKI